MANIIQMKDSANAVFYPQTHEKAVVDSNGVNLQTKLASITTPTYVTAWDGDSTPVVANIPAGVTVTYNTTSYTGTLAASASTANKTYLVSTGTTDNYNRYVTQLNGSTYSWQNLGSTEIDLSDYATKAELNQLDQKVTGIFTDGDRVNSRVKEVYIIGADNSKKYRFKNMNVYAGEYYGLSLYAYTQNDYSDEVKVAGWVGQFAGDVDGVITLHQSNSSGVTCLIYAKVKTTDAAVGNGIINMEMATNLRYSPTIAEAIKKSPFMYPDCVRDQYFQLYSVSGLDQTKKYYFSALNLAGGNFTAYLYQYTQANRSDAVQVATYNKAAATPFNGRITLDEMNGSGIKVTFSVKGSVPFQSIPAGLELKEEIIRSNFGAVAEESNKAKVAESLPFLSSEVLERLGNSDHNGGMAIDTTGQTKPTFATFENMAFSEDGILSLLTFRAKGTSMTFGIGIIDQRNLPVVRTSFTVDCTADTLTTVDITNRSIRVYAGETLFAIFQLTNESICFTTNESASDLQMLYGANELHRLNTTYGGVINLYWETKKLDSPFALKDDVATNAAQIQVATNMASQALSNFAMVRDRSGNYYQLVVVNNELQIVPLQYKKVLVLCNSIGRNGRVYSAGWCGIRGMASSKEGMDFITHLENGLKVKDNTATVSLKNIWEWERDFDSITPASLMSGVLSNDIDCIIFRAGENIPNNREDVKENVMALLNYCVSQCPNANVFITSLVWDNEKKNKALADTANAMGVTFIDVAANADVYKERTGDYLEGGYTSDGGTTWDDSQQVLYKISSAISGHPNDVAMLLIANNILSALKYATVDLLHNITVGSIGSNTCELITNKWVTGGIVNVFSDGTTVSVVDSGNNSISVTDHNDGVFTFVMPDSDVTISVS